MRLGTGVLGDKPASIVFTHDAKDDANRNSYSFTVGFGAAAAGRKILVVVHTFGGLGTNINSVTIGGATPTLLIQHPNTTRFRLYLVDLPTGTSGTVAVSYSGTQASGCAITVWAAYDLKSATPIATATDVMAASDASADVSVNTRGGGVVVAAAHDGDNGTNQTWTGVAEDVENTSTIDNWARSGASANVTSGESPRAITVTSSITTATRFALAASFR